MPADTGAPWSWTAGHDGRVLDPLCEAAPDILTDGATMVMVHAEFAGAEQSVVALRSGALVANVVASQLIPSGPVLSSRPALLVDSGTLGPSRREEQLVVIRADKPQPSGSASQGHTRHGPDRSLSIRTLGATHRLHADHSWEHLYFLKASFTFSAASLRFESPSSMTIRR